MTSLSARVARARWNSPFAVPNASHSASAAALTEMRLLFLVADEARDVHERYLQDNVHVTSLVEAGELVRASIVLEEYLLRAEQHLVGRYAEQLKG